MKRQIAVVAAMGGSLLIAASPAWADSSGSSGSSAGPATVGSNTVTSTTGTATELPRTGNDVVAPGLAAGFGLLIAGAGMVVAGRRRSPEAGRRQLATN
jgi:LPXTG-motif cell wall-anchored protein